MRDEIAQNRQACPLRPEPATRAGLQTKKRLQKGKLRAGFRAR
jgi:hypothetical protein